MQNELLLNVIDNKLSLDFSGELTLYSVPAFQKKIDSVNLSNVTNIEVNLQNLQFLDTAGAIFLLKLQDKLTSMNLQVNILNCDEVIQATIDLVDKQKLSQRQETQISKAQDNFIKKYVNAIQSNVVGFVSFMDFFGKLFMTAFLYAKSIKNVRFKEIMFEINESGLKALGIISLTSFLIGLVVAYQSAFQLKIYGANIFIVDMLGLSILRELAPLITAIVIAGRSGSAFTAQIGAMKITQELDAMKTMGFDPFSFLVMPRIIALMITLPILVFVADVMAIVGGMIVANVDLGITSDLFLDRFREVIDAKHFFVGIVKAPFFAFLIAAIGIYRGLVVKDDTQSIGVNTTKSVVESIFAVIVCDALFSIAFTNLGI